MPPKLGIVAGGGGLPARLIAACRAAGRPFFVIALEGQADPALPQDTLHAWVRLGAAGEAIARLHAEKCQDLVFVGTVRRPSLADLRPDGWTAWFLARTGTAAMGDDSLLSALVRTLEHDEGFRVVAVESVLPDLLAREGAYGRQAPGAEDRDDIATAVAAALDLGARDIGQAAVARNGYVVALEHTDGTDAMLARLAEDAPPSPPRGVLAKVRKPGQESRVDLPTVGTETVRAAARAGLRGIVIEAGGALIADASQLAAAADDAGIFVAGIAVARPENERPAAAPAAPAEDGPLVVLIAGEPSGDALGARLMAALKTKTGGKIRFAGVGGDKMAAEGLISRFPMSDIAVMGLFEVLPRLPKILVRIAETADWAERLCPDAVVTIDSPDFNFRVAARLKKRLKGKGFPLIHYVAPTVWAWRPGRARAVARLYARLMTLLPFEPPYFEREGLAAAFVGHSVLESGAGEGNGSAFRDRHAISLRASLLCILPGSRRSEIRALLPVFGEALARIAVQIPDLRVVVPTIPAITAEIRAATSAWPGNPLVIEAEGEKYDAFAAAQAALAASGTVSLELALAGTPHVIAYRVNPITAWLARRLVRVRFVNLVNLVLDRAVVPELLQDDCTGATLADAVLVLFRDPRAREAQRAAFTEAMRRLSPGEETPSAHAADMVLDTLAHYTSKTENKGQTP